jgi:hypothetical protein
MPRFDVSVTERDPAPTQADRAQKCKCKCECVAPLPGPWSRVPAAPTAAAVPPRVTELSPLSD